MWRLTPLHPVAYSAKPSFDDALLITGCANDTAGDRDHGSLPGSRRRVAIGCAVLIVVSLKLCTSGIDWGMPAAVSWAPDTIAGSRTLYTIGHGPTDWPTHYPPLHFYINRLAYWPVLDYWKTVGECSVDSHTGSVSLAPPITEKLSLLVIISRGITVLMSVASVLILAAVATTLFADRTTGFFAGMTLATCAEWVYFSHLGTLDVPHMFWFTLSLYGYVRAWQTDNWRHYILLGLCTALAVSTKDAVAGMYVGVALVLAVSRVARASRSGASITKALYAAVHPKMLCGLAACLLPYAVIHGLLIDPRTYIARLDYYLTGPGTSDVNQSYGGPMWLAREAMMVSLKAFGWPGFAAIVCSVCHGLWKWRLKTLILIAPIATYYLTVCSYTGIVFARTLFPAYICLAILVGRSCRGFLTWSRVPIAWRIGGLCALFIGSMGYSTAVDMELTHDTRYRAEEWLNNHVEPTEPIGVFSHPQYLPRFTLGIHRAIPLEMTPETFTRKRPTYLVLSSFNYDDYNDARKECMADLRSGVLGYSPVATFSKQYLPPARSWLAVVGWGTRGAGKASPDIIILKDMTQREAQKRR